MKCLMLIKHSESYRQEQIPQGLMDAMGAFVAKGFESGVLKDTAGLKPTKDAHRVRLSGGKIQVTDGPFTEAREVIGGYAVIEAKSEAELLEIARQFMDIHLIHWPEFEGECEVRPLEDR